MREKSINNITEVDIQNLILNKVIENKVLEYKRDLNISKDSDKKEFLADVTSFANAGGGDILIGVSSDNTTGEPQKLVGIATTNIDYELQKIDQVILSGIRPKISGLQIWPIKLAEASYVILVRIPNSWNSPHMVTLQSTNKFYTRSSNGKHLMDVDELRMSFTLSERISEKINAFRLDRIGKIFANESYLPLPALTGRVVLHIIPFSAFSNASRFDFSKVQNYQTQLRPMRAGGWDHQFNLDGFIGFSNDGSYVQLFKNGIIEAVDTSILSVYQTTAGYSIPSQKLESTVLEAFSNYLKLLYELKIEFPLVVSLSLVDIKKYSFATSGGYAALVLSRKLKSNKDVINLPESLLQDYSMPPSVLFKPIFDCLWNAYGYQGSENFDALGNWKPRD
ncbi:MAG: ATP-binding protein [Cyclobacteriaceae bacterium]|nr:ATP-binding protein [Cyclobacteriaceae bacterium]